MPPKTSQKRSRESTGTATKLAADSATAAAVAAPGSAPLLRRGRSSSVTSQEEGNADNDDAPRPKRSKRDRNSGRESGASDASMGEEDMDVEGKEDEREEKEQDVGNGRAGGANASSKRAGAAKKSTGGRRRASAASAAVAGGGPGEVSLVIVAGAELAADSTLRLCSGTTRTITGIYSSIRAVYVPDSASDCSEFETDADAAVYCLWCCWFGLRSTYYCWFYATGRFSLAVREKCNVF